MSTHFYGPMPLGSPEDFISSIKSSGHVSSYNDLKNDPFASLMQKQANAFTGIVAGLSHENNPHACIQDLMRDVWSIVGNDIVRVAAIPTNPVKELSFVAFKENDNLKAMLLLPLNLADVLGSKPIYAMGAGVFVGSQIRDFYNEKLFPPEDMILRAEMYEAEFLMRCTKLEEFNSFQKSLLEKYPNGVDTKPELIYSPKQVPPNRTHGTYN